LLISNRSTKPLYKAIYEDVKSVKSQAVKGFLKKLFQSFSLLTTTDFKIQNPKSKIQNPNSDTFLPKCFLQNAILF
jgi:dsRNA-specific ribonuclease